MRIVAIDPGLEGGLAGIDFDDRTYEWRPMPLFEIRLGKSQKRRRWIDVGLADRFILGYAPDCIVLETQSPMPKQSAVSTFSLGANFGKLRGIALEYRGKYPWCRIVNAQPVTWKGELGVPAEKPEATAMCRAIFGEGSPKKDGPAEALLIGYWYWKRRQIHGDRADAGILVEPRTLATKTAFLTGHDPGRSGAFHGEYTPPLGRAPGRLFATRDRGDATKARAVRKGRSKGSDRAGVPDPAL